MKNLALTVFLSVLIGVARAQSDSEQVQKTCINYLEGFYEGDTVKLQNAFKASTYKIGFWKEKGDYSFAGQMSYRQAMDYARGVLEKKQFAKEDSPKKVEVLDVLENIASAKVTAWWGYDYILLSKKDDKWLIEQVLWEGPHRK